MNKRTHNKTNFFIVMFLVIILSALAQNDGSSEIINEGEVIESDFF